MASSACACLDCAARVGGDVADVAHVAPVAAALAHVVRRAGAELLGGVGRAVRQAVRVEAAHSTQCCRVRFVITRSTRHAPWRTRSTRLPPVQEPSAQVASPSSWMLMPCAPGFRPVTSIVISINLRPRLFTASRTVTLPATPSLPLVGTSCAVTARVAGSRPPAEGRAASAGRVGASVAAAATAAAASAARRPSAAASEDADACGGGAAQRAGLRGRALCQRAARMVPLCGNMAACGGTRLFCRGACAACAPAPSAWRADSEDDIAQERRGRRCATEARPSRVRKQNRGVLPAEEV
jgi:hypothetical protein